MEDKKEMSLSQAWKEFKESFRYAVEAKQGKFSLSVYLNRLSDSIDTYIKEIQVKENSQFQSGHIEVSSEQGNLNFLIHLNFLTHNKTVMEKILYKSIPLTQFTDDTLSELERGKKIYAVDAPEE